MFEFEHAKLNKLIKLYVLVNGLKSTQISTLKSRANRLPFINIPALSLLTNECFASNLLNLIYNSDTRKAYLNHPNLLTLTIVVGYDKHAAFPLENRLQLKFVSSNATKFMLHIFEREEHKTLVPLKQDFDCLGWLISEIELSEEELQAEKRKLAHLF